MSASPVLCKRNLRPLTWNAFPDMSWRPVKHCADPLRSFFSSPPSHLNEFGSSGVGSILAKNMFVLYTALHSLGDSWPRVSFSDTLFFLWAGEGYWIDLFQANQLEYSSSARWKINHRSWNRPGQCFQNPDWIITLSVLSRNEGTGTWYPFSFKVFCH